MPFSCSHTTHAQQPSTLARFRVFRTEKMQCFARKVHHTYKTLSDRYTPQSLNTRPDQSLPDQSPRTQNRSTWVRPTRIVAAPRKCTNLFTLTKNRLFHRSRTKVRQGGNIFPLTCNVAHRHAAQSSRQAACLIVVSGGGGRDRTDDPLLAKQVLSQLSYAPRSRNHHSRGGPGRT